MVVVTGVTGGAAGGVTAAGAAGAAGAGEPLEPDPLPGTGAGEGTERSVGAGALDPAPLGVGPAVEDERAPTDAPAPASSAGNDSRILRTTGGSIVDDADRTNSPCSLRCWSNVLLSTPSSLASS